MNLVATLALVIITGLQPITDHHTSAYDNKYVRFEYTLNRASFAPGDTGTVFIFLTPNEGVHVNTEPPVDYEFEKQPQITFGEKAVMPKDSITGYLDAQQPVAISFTLDKKIPAGTYTVKGKMKYFFCSEKEGWCNQFVQPLTLTIQVKK
jgi:hypothetical protein